ncbi:uncharacterized protein [Blastocystis hominis]|uniref:Uncharacterized protein n=1 Tax=Blastocystis hominis TaxID=12968 RepID=D8M1D7_BLAHO|nr:uncharacterized protein [Blastocystis hominis]CBK21876.2 unnamed protein product [Blastocystis hominis]|eukprot:XP_012895924.1 uncharacterized protein [Blastocystis hominis]
MKIQISRDFWHFATEEFISIMATNGRHTILLIQRGRAASRSYWDFPTVNQCMQFLIDYFERELINLNPAKPKLSYTVSDIYNQLDSFEECNMLVYNPETNSYNPYGREYIKERLLKYLQHLGCFVCSTNTPHFANCCELCLETIGHVRSSRILMTSNFLLRVRFRSLDVFQLASWGTASQNASAASQGTSPALRAPSSFAGGC